MKKNITYREKEITYHIHGSGDPLVLVHGFGEDGSVWQQQVEHLEENYRVIVPDLPGSGRSESIDDHSMESMAEVLHALLLAEDISTCTIVGHSMGGYILLAFAEKYGSMLTRFGLFHSSAYADAEEKKETRKKGIAFIRENGAYAFLKTATPNLFSPHTRENNPGLVERQVALGQQFGDDVLISYYEAMMRRPDRTAVLKEATVPVLFVMGKYDQAVPVDDSLKQSHLPAVSHIHILENSGHMGMLEEAEKANGILAKFMAAGTLHAHLSS